MNWISPDLIHRFWLEIWKFPKIKVPSIKVLQFSQVGPNFFLRDNVLTTRSKMASFLNLLSKSF